jgi:hypothetical protein
MLVRKPKSSHNIVPSATMSSQIPYLMTRVLRGDRSVTIHLSRDTALYYLMMGTETVPETLDFNELTRLSAREDFINLYYRLEIRI